MQPFKLLCIREETLELRIDFFRALRLASPNKIIPYFFERQKEKSQLCAGSLCLNHHSSHNEMAYFDSSDV